MEERYDQYGDETILDLKEALVYTLRQWRRIAIFVLVGAILFAGVNGGSLIIGSLNSEYSKSSKESNKAAKKSYEIKREAQDSKIKTLRRQIKTQEKLQKDSIFLNLNPYDLYRASRSYYVDTGYKIMPDSTYQDIDKTRSVISAYTNVDKQAYLYNQVKKNKNIKMSARSYTELVSIWADYGSRFLHVRAYAEDKKTAKALLDETCKALLKKKKKISRSITSHDMKVNKDVVERTADTSVTKRQNDFQADLSARYKELSKLEKAKANKSIKKPELIPISASNIFVKIVKWLIIGAIIGMLIGLLWFFITFILRGIIGGPSSLKEQYGIRTLGRVEKDIEGYNIVDKVIDKIDGITAKDRDEDEAIAYIAANMGNYNEDNKPIKVIGTAKLETMEKISEGLKDAVDAAEIECCGDIITSPLALKAMGDDAKVVIVEERQKSTKKKLQKEIEILKSLDKDIMGVILA